MIYIITRNDWCCIAPTNIVNYFQISVKHEVELIKSINIVRTAVQKQTAVIAYMKIKHLLLFACAQQSKELLQSQKAVSVYS